MGEFRLRRNADWSCLLPWSSLKKLADLRFRGPLRLLLTQVRFSEVICFEFAAHIANFFKGAMRDEAERSFREVPLSHRAVV